MPALDSRIDELYKARRGEFVSAPGGRRDQASAHLRTESPPRPDSHPDTSKTPSKVSAQEIRRREREEALAARQMEGVISKAEDAVARAKAAEAHARDATRGIAQRSISKRRSEP